MLIVRTGYARRVTRRPPDDESRPLNEEEQRALDLIERTLHDEEPRLTRRLGGRPVRTTRLAAVARELAGGLAVAGFALTYVGIALDAVLVGFSGFLLMLAGVDHLLSAVDGGRLAHRLMRKLRLDPSSSRRR